MIRITASNTPMPRTLQAASLRYIDAKPMISTKPPIQGHGDIASVMPRYKGEAVMTSATPRYTDAMT
jgi:hypothetical protein